MFLRCLAHKPEEKRRFDKLEFDIFSSLYSWS